MPKNESWRRFSLILFGSALVTAFQGEEDSKPDLTGVLDTMTEALEEESERLAG